MKKIVTLTAALLALSATMALAQGGLNLFSNGCSADVGASSSATFACDVNTGSNQLYASVIVPADMPMFTGTTAIIDVTVGAPALPSWWQVQPGGCRANAFSLSFDPANVATTGCNDIWAGSTNTPIQQVQVGLHGPNTLRLIGGAALTAGSEIPIVADGSELNVARVTISHINTLSCSGCDTPVCLTLSECYLQQPGLLPQYRVTTPISNTVSFNNSGQLDCVGATPAKNRTWGQVKSLYR